MKTILSGLLLGGLPILIGFLMLLNLKRQKAIAENDQEIAVVHCIAVAIAIGLIGIGIGVTLLIAVVMWLI